MGYLIYDRDGNVIGEQESEQEKRDREGCLGLVVLLVVGIGYYIYQFVVKYWWVILILVVVGVIVWLLIKNRHK